MMISDPNSIYYACIAKQTTILAEFNSRDADLGALAVKCLEKNPHLHSMFTHTVRNRTYTFLFDDDVFCYFVIFDDKLDNSEGLAFLKRVRDAFNGFRLGKSGKKRLEKLTSRCIQGEFNLVFHQLLSSNSEGDNLIPQLTPGSNGSSDSSSIHGGGAAPAPKMPLLGDAVNCLKQKKRLCLGDCASGGDDSSKGGGGKGTIVSERGLDCSSDNGIIGLSRDFSVTMNKNVMYSGELGHPQKARKVWKKHVWVVLSMDVIICTILFVVWLSICGGFKCIDN